MGLTTIQHITGSLSIELYNHETFPFLSNLKTVGSDFSEVNTFPCDKNTLQLPYSIYITETDLVSIDLSSLRDINGGGVSIDNNPFLCYIGDLSRYTRNVSADLCLGNHYRRPMEECCKIFIHNILYIYIYIYICDPVCEKGTSGEFCEN